MGGAAVDCVGGWGGVGDAQGGAAAVEEVVWLAGCKKGTATKWGARRN